MFELIRMDQYVLLNRNKYSFSEVGFWLHRISP